MPKTAVGLFEDSSLAAGVVSDIEVIGFPRNEIRVQGEPLDFGVSGVTGIPHLEFELGLTRELMKIGATQTVAETLVRGVARGGALIFATGPDQMKVDAAAEVMNRHGAVDIEEVTGREPDLRRTTPNDDTSSAGEGSVQAGRVRYAGGGARVFVW